MMRIIIQWGIIAMVLLSVASAGAHNYADTVVAYTIPGEEPGFETYYSGLDVSAIPIEETISAIEPSVLESFLSDTNSLFVALPLDVYVVLGFTSKTLIDGPGDDLTVYDAQNDDAADVYVFFDYADEAMTEVDWDTMTYLGRAQGSTSFDLASLGNMENRSVVAVKIEGLDNNGNPPGFDLKYIEIAEASVGPALNSGITAGITGSVKDAATNLSLQGAGVVVNGGQFSTVTSENGDYAIRGIPAGTAVVEVSLGGYADAEKVVDLVGGETLALDFSLNPKGETESGSIRGNVTDAFTGQPLANAEVVVNGGLYADVTTELGNFSIDGIAAGLVIITVSLDGYADVSMAVTLTAGQLLPLDLALEPEGQTGVTTGSLTGSVVDSVTGLPLNGAQVVVNDGLFSEVTSGQGQYVLENIPSGEGGLLVFLDGYQTISRDFKLEAGQTLFLDFELEKILFSSISGKIINADGKDPIADAVVKISSGEFTRSTKTTSDGLYEFTGLTAGIYSAEVSAPGFVTKQRSDITLGGGLSVVANIKLVPNAPRILALTVSPVEFESGGMEEVTFTAKVYDPDGADDITSVVLGHQLLSSVLPDGVEMSRLTTEADVDPGVAFFQYKTRLLSSLSPRDYLLNVLARDQFGFYAADEIAFSVIQKKQVVLENLESISEIIRNTFAKQTLVISVKVGSELFYNAISIPDIGIGDGFGNQRRAAEEECGDCYVEVKVYRPDLTLYGTYTVCESTNITIPNAEAGNWVYETVSHCTDSLDVEVETRGADTAVLTGTVRDSDTGIAVSSAKIEWDLGGEAYASVNGYFSAVVVAGEGTAITSLQDYQTNLKANITLISGETKQIEISIIPEEVPPTPVPTTLLIEEIVEPLKRPDPDVQPFAAGIIDDNLKIGALFPPYVSQVWIYLALHVNHPDLLPYLFFFDTSDLLALPDESGAFVPWRKECCTWQQVDSILTLPVDILPEGKYTFFFMITDDPDELKTFDLKFFSVDIPASD